MHRTRQVIGVLLALGVWGFGSWGFGGTASLEAPDKPARNVILILVDDMGWTDLGCFGSEFYRTPNIDRLANDGMRFTDAYSACTVCSPTRASVMTGRYPARLRVTDWIKGHVRRDAKLNVPDWTMELRHEETTIAERLRSRGYATAHVGKWHLGDEEFWPQHQGFDLNAGGYHKGQPPSYFSPYRIPTLADGPKGEYLTTREAAEVTQFIERHHAEQPKKPFFVYLPHYAVHTPIQAEPDVTEQYRARVDPKSPHRNAKYAAMIDAVDRSLGSIRAKLDALGLSDDTAIIFASDNGGLLGVTSNVPLRAGKGSAYEGGVRTPLIVHWPGVTRPGTESSVPVITPDLVPTIVELTGGKPEKGAFDGVSLAPVLRGTGGLKDAKGEPRTSIFWHYPHYHPGGADPYGAIRRGSLKLIEHYEDMSVELYDLAEDIGETKDLAASRPRVTQQLRDELRAWRKRVKAQMPTPNPTYEPDTESHPKFHVVRDIRIADRPGGYTLKSRATGIALRRVKGERRKLTIRTTVTAIAGPWRNGFIGFGDGDREQDMVWVGLFIGGGRLSIYEGKHPSQLITEVRTKLDKGATHELRVSVDLDAGIVTATTGDQTVTRKLTRVPKNLRMIGFALHRTTIEVGEIVVGD